MNNFIIYSIEIAISLALFYTAYWVFLKNETFFKLNRFYLVASVIISLSLPILNISIITGENSFMTENFILPIHHYEQSLIGNIDDENILANEEINSAKKNNAKKKAATLIETNKPELNNAAPIPENSPESSSFGNKINWLTIVFAIYFTGMALFLIRFAANFIWIFSYVLKYSPQQIFGMKVIRFEKNFSPFSFLNFIFIGKKEYPEAELTKIISHEKVHISQKHSIDIILFELLLVFQWFNPFVWSYKRAIKITHEYLADQGTLNSGIDLPGYQYSLLNHALSENNFEIASNYNLSVKKRIEMMMKKRSPKLSALKLSIALPIIIFLFSAFAFNCNSPKKDADQIATKVTSDKDSSIKKVDVPVEYLRSLEGEYLSTNETRERRIIFTEMLGTLYGLDNGYTYRIIPIGGEKFTNPDDKASLIFDSKDKNAISLLLFGKVNLKKKNLGSGEAQNRSMAFTLAKKMLGSGIPAAITFYKSIGKDSMNYWFTEYEMSYAGYELIKAGKLKEAVALLKLDTERFSGSFNSYDSYAEALLASGEKTQAIENFKKSVQLNPGSINGLKRLKELGVNTEGLIKKVELPLAYLNLLTGDYLSTDQPNWMRRIKFTIEQGVLVGNDNGYIFKLIPMGDGKFINPDDGESLVFNTKDVNKINLLLFGTTNLRKVKIWNAPELPIKNYTGIYIPSEKDVILKPMVIKEENNKLIRFLESEPIPANRMVALEFVTENIFYYTDKSNRSVEFILNDKKEITGAILRRWDGTFKLTKQK